MRNWPNIETFEEFLNAGGLVEPNDQMPEPYRLAVFRFIELHANSEYMGGLTERDSRQAIHLNLGEIRDARSHFLAPREKPPGNDQRSSQLHLAPALAKI